ncbi:leucine-rich repeat and guanylate kinase domain-containing protein isoform X2 [Vidua chalybeata]|uniref:leucine-rich repeat and guanylate kinase domain-containing protein isoform X2 n=1 Tax=Vidua chalybeata TaxID=81927 RepID=UPI0023A87542|nr:leucine-rich repeat and guanylate kinase domain-containing protein isoform X2 [Vidua chalybeata]
MAGGEENGTGDSLGEPLPPPDEPPQPVAEGFPEEQPRPGPPHRQDEQEEDGEEEESERSEGHLEGVLDEDTAAEGLHTFGRSALGTEYVYLHLSLPGRELRDISILSGYIHLQKMELSSNKINDLSCISHMPYLVELNASKNELTTYFNFKAPKNLKEVDFSHNQIPKMKDLSAYHSLTKLLLDFNEIEEIRGLEECHSLTQLGLSHNRLAAVRGLQNLPIRILNLSFNQIEKVDGLKSLKTLQRVDLSNNKINSLQGLEEHDLLEVINLEDNQVAELSELKWIEDLPLLRVLNLLKNPLQEKGDYRLLAIFMLLQVTELDLKKVSVEEKVAAVNEEDPPPEVVAAEDHRIQTLNNVRQPQRVLASTLPGFDEPYPMLVLLGPVAGGRRQLSLKICRQFKNFFRFGPCHTTRTAYFGEENRFDYYFISQEEFDKMVNTGKFLVTYKYSGHSYGLGRDTVESIAREGLATCVHLEIEGVRSLKKTHFKPRYVLLVPKDKWKYGEHLRRTGLFSRPEIEEAVSRVDMYLQINQDCPGYFSAVIYTDELDEAFTELTRLVKVYLGLEPPDSVDNVQGTRSRAGSRNQLFPEEKLSPGKGTPARSRTPSFGGLLDPSAKNCPRDLQDLLTAPPGSVEEASLQRRFSAAHQLLLFHRDLDPESGRSHQQLPKPVPPLSSGASSGLQEQNLPRATPESSSRGFGRVRAHVSVPPDAAPAGVDQVLWTKLPVPQRHLPGEARGAGKGVGTSKEAEGRGENLLRKRSKAKSLLPQQVPPQSPFPAQKMGFCPSLEPWKSQGFC